MIEYLQKLEWTYSERIEFLNSILNTRVKNWYLGFSCKRDIDDEEETHTIFKLTTYNGGASKKATPFNSVPVHLCKIILGPEAINSWPWRDAKADIAPFNSFE